MTRRREPINQRFERLTTPEPNSGCLIWLGSVARAGYGSVSHEGRVRPAHRVAWELAHGRPVPAGLSVCHKCDVRCCVNPDHLFVGTAQENTLDCLRKGRHHNQTHPEAPHNRKLSDADVHYLRSVYRRRHPQFSIAALARQYGVEWNTMWKAVTGQSFASLPGVVA